MSLAKMSPIGSAPSLSRVLWLSLSLSLWLEILVSQPLSPRRFRETCFEGPGAKVHVKLIEATEGGKTQ